MKGLIIGGNRFVGLRVSLLLQDIPNLELHILNRTGQAPHCPTAIVHKGDRRHLQSLYLDQDWDFVYDFACFNQAEAENSLSFFKNVKRYIFISTASVYNYGVNLRETDFLAKDWDLKIPPPKMDYQNGKRRAEAVFAQQAPFPVLSVRLPFILGPDDYTQRLQFHIEHVQRQQAIYLPNAKAKVSMIHSQEAAAFLRWALTQSLAGPINVASELPLSIGELLTHIELILGTKPILAQKPTETNASPYCPYQDCYMNTDLLKKTGFQVRPILDWLPDLIGQPVLDKKGFVH